MMKSKGKRPLKDYFDDDDDDSYNPIQNIANKAAPVLDDEVDPLDAFMQEVGEQIEVEKTIESAPLPEIISDRDREYEDYFKAKSVVDADKEEGDDIQYDSDGVPIGVNEKKLIEPLPPVDHSKIKYEPFIKNIYKECLEISKLSDAEVSDFKNESEISIIGSGIIRPIQSFKHAGFQPLLLKEIVKVGYEIPTPIQCQTLPVAMSGRDLIGLAKTGSGKTMSYVWPLLEHILIQPQMKLGDGPIGLILAPTRELAAQIYSETTKFAKVFGIRVCAIFGGSGKWEMTKALKEAPEIVVATPGRFIDLARSKATNLQRCTMVILDEADRMFEMGFEYQMRSILNNIRPDRQTLMFSATMKKKVEGFARDMLRDPLRVVIGTIGQANPDIKQIAELVHDADHKWRWLSSRLDEFVAEGKVLVFVGTKSDAEEVGTGLRRYFASRQLVIGIDILHGDKDQSERSQIMRKFKAGETSVLVATDIAARGLDIKNVLTVVNYDVAKNIETHVHRIGRTGRMGVEGVTPGTAYTLVTPVDGAFAVDLVRNLEMSSQPVAADLLRLAQADPKWQRRKNHSGGGAGSGGFSGGGRGGLGFGAGGGPRAMTSAMLAEQSAGSSDMAANPYIEGRSMGRGKHLNTPSWAAASVTAPAQAAPAPSTSAGLSETGEKKRLSRFSKMADAPPPPPAAAPLSGFVRAAGDTARSTLSSVAPGAAYSAPKWVQQALSAPPPAPPSTSATTPSDTTIQGGGEQRKKSRWDS